MDYDTILLDTEERMEKALTVLKEKYRGMRTGRANPGLVDGEGPARVVAAMTAYEGMPCPGA